MALLIVVVLARWAAAAERRTVARARSSTNVECLELEYSADASCGNVS